LSRLVGNASEREAHDTLQTAACRDQKTHEDICVGFLATILTEPHSAAKVSLLSLQTVRIKKLFTTNKGYNLYLCIVYSAFETLPLSVVIALQ